jgi:hypothetical protein
VDGEDLAVDDAVRVERSGIALVHEGELIVPAQGAAAELSSVGSLGSVGSADGARPTEVHYWFPVQVEVVGLDGPAADAVVARVFDELGRELGARG